MSGTQVAFAVVSSLVALSALVISISNTRYSRRKDQEAEIAKLRDALAALQADHKVTQKQISLFWSVVEKGIGNMLHSPHREELDRLIEKNARRERLKPEEISRFSELIQEIIDGQDTTQGERAGAIVYKAAVLARHGHVNH